MSNQDKEVVLVTGCGSGIGKALARAFHRAGHRVCATARRPEPMADLACCARAAFSAMSDALRMERLPFMSKWLPVEVRDRLPSQPFMLDGLTRS